MNVSERVNDEQLRGRFLADAVYAAKLVESSGLLVKLSSESVTSTALKLA